jgi:hypothetical protein
MLVRVVWWKFWQQIFYNKKEELMIFCLSPRVNQLEIIAETMRRYLCNSKGNKGEIPFKVQIDGITTKHIKMINPLMSHEEATKKSNDYYDRTCSTVKHFADVRLLAGRDASFRFGHYSIEDRKLSERLVEEINSKEWKGESVPPTLVVWQVGCPCYASSLYQK